jgi:NTP pyrophosphatase (non-canonical NTP hydrolase)
MNNTFNDLEIKVRNWAISKGIDKPENAPKQMLKVMEEVGETAGALLKNKEDEIKDGIGDSFVTLIILCQQLGYSPTECLQLAYNEIENRKGKTINGVFVKEENLSL